MGRGKHATSPPPQIYFQSPSFLFPSLTLYFLFHLFFFSLMFFMFIICHFSSILYLFMMEKYVWKGIYWNLYVLHQIILLSADLWCDIVKMERVLNPYLKFLGQPVYHLVRHFVSVLSPNILSCLYAPWYEHINWKVMITSGISFYTQKPCTHKLKEFFFFNIYIPKSYELISARVMRYLV